MGHLLRALTELRAEIAAAPDAPATLQLCTTIASGYRVYLAVLPQAHLTVGADRADFAVDLSEALIAEFDEAVERAIEAGVDARGDAGELERRAGHGDHRVGPIVPAHCSFGTEGSHDDGRAAVRALRDAVGDVTP